MSLPKLLFIESHGPLAQLLKETLTRAAGLTVVGAAESVEEAIPLLLPGEIDAVIIDLNVVDMDRLEALSTIMHRAPATRIILLIDQDDERYYATAAQKGAQACVRKQTIATELIPVVHRVLVN
jgi:DNA-binding NarL/FixJ family response regulator